ncbi:MAG: DUF1295 domain-containing protein [Pirellulales bacterium]|nr:DUF1295 domain-containing protein [Pirellulales bacterium]
MPSVSDTLVPLAIGLCAASAGMAALWVVQRRTENAGIVDVAWSGTIGVLAVFYASWPAGEPWLRAVVAGMLGAWSLRLTAYLYRRVVGHPEEGRYRTLRANWGANADRKLFWFFQMQAVAAWAFAGNALAVARSPEPPAAWLIAIAVATWAIGIGGAAAADRQLAAFKRDPSRRSKTCRRGLWRFSRHPNYFFEWLHWCSYVPLAGASPGWWVPVTIAGGLLYLLLFVTGIPPTERQALATRGEEYREYQRTTSAFVPWFPRRSGR